MEGGLMKRSGRHYDRVIGFLKKSDNSSRLDPAPRGLQPGYYEKMVI
jgi:hypothetical protein